MSDPIDAVLTWVDGEDPTHVAKRKAYDPGFGAAGIEATRFASRDEENYPARMLAALRNQFGGHAIKKAE